MGNCFPFAKKRLPLLEDSLYVKNCYHCKKKYPTSNLLNADSNILCTQCRIQFDDIGINTF